jgi:iron complex transport system ATP-binding protein
MPSLLEFQNITVARENGKIALDSISLSIDIGENVAIIGPNGSGKSTLIKTITRDLYPLANPESSLQLMGQRTWNVFDLRAMLGIVSNDLMSICTREITGREAVLSGFFSSIGIWPHQQITEGMEVRAGELLEFLEVPHLADRDVVRRSAPHPVRSSAGA